MTNEEALKFAKEQTYIFGGTMKEFLQFVIDKLERPQGEWNYIQAGMCVCPFCGAMPHKEYKNFCANCGADMRGAE